MATSRAITAEVAFSTNTVREEARAGRRAGFLRRFRRALLERLRGECDEIARRGGDEDVRRVGAPADGEERQRLDREPEARAGERRDPSRGARPLRAPC